MKLYLACVFVLMGFTHQVQGGFPNLLCPKNGDRNATVFFPCSEDCQHQHGAVGGECGDPFKGDYNCYCGKLRGTRYEKSLHCAKSLDDAYRNTCTVDCICNHGALGGHCDWGLKACTCYGQNPNNVQCQFKTILEFAKYTVNTVGPEGLGEHGMKYVGPVISGQVQYD